jgi:hypothetical protein
VNGLDRSLVGSAFDSESTPKLDTTLLSLLTAQSNLATAGLANRLNLCK